MAVRAAAAAGLTNAATAEFLLDPDGVVLVSRGQRAPPGGAWRDGARDRPRPRPRTVLHRGGPALSARPCWRPLRSPRIRSRHAIEVRLSAEDPANAFAPAPGRIDRGACRPAPGVRVDTAIEAGERIPPDYDPLIAKLMVDARTARRRSRGCGVPSTKSRSRASRRRCRSTGLSSGIPEFAAGDVSTDWVGEEWDGPAERARALEIAAVVASSAQLGPPRPRPATRVRGADMPRPRRNRGDGHRVRPRLGSRGSRGGRGSMAD